MQAQCHAGQRVVAVQHHVRGVDLGDDVDRVGRHVRRAAARRQAFEGHAGLQRVGEQRAVLEAHQLGAVVAEGVFGFQVQVQLVAGGVAGQCFLHLGQQVVAAVEELHRLVLSSSIGRFCASISVQVRLTTQGASMSSGDDRTGRAGGAAWSAAAAKAGRAARLLGAGRQNARMDVNIPLPLLGGLSPAAFMRRHWQKKPLLVRQAWPGVAPPLPRAALFALAARDDVESRLVVRQSDAGWTLRRGPLPRRALPPLQRRGLDAAGAGAGPARRRRARDAAPLRLRARGAAGRPDDLLGQRWRRCRPAPGCLRRLPAAGARPAPLAHRPRADERFVDGVPLKILQAFEPEQEWLLEPGDLLYLPPRWGHDGVAEGECMTVSVGFRAASREELARELLARLADGDAPAAAERRYRDAAQPATATPGRVPEALQRFARQAVEDAARAPGAVERALGEWLSEPKAEVWFDAAVPGEGAAQAARGVRLDPRSRMLYDDAHVYLNGESWRAGGRDARLLRRLADEGRLGERDRAALGVQAAAVLDEWLRAGWLQAEER
jgi:50S ribosomal protein L16 3-hydroxylase